MPTELAVDHRFVNLNSDVISLRITAVLEIEIPIADTTELILVENILDARKFWTDGETAVQQHFLQ